MNQHVYLTIGGSFLFGFFLNNMIVNIYKYNHAYFSTKILLYNAMFMAALTGVSISIITKNCNLMGLFLIISFIIFIMMRTQFMVNDQDWLKHTITNHSVTLTTSYKIKEKTKNKEIKQLAENIISQQEKEINIMKKLLEKKN